MITNNFLIFRYHKKMEGENIKRFSSHFFLDIGEDVILNNLFLF